MREIHDKYFRLAKREGRLARSFYKLEELDRRCQLFRKGDRVLDLGACPGSWLEYILPRIGEGGVACAVDLKPIHKRFKGKVHFRKMDVNDLTAGTFADEAPQFDAVVSDIAPNTSGIKATDQARSQQLCETAFAYAEEVLKAGGHFVCKVLEGPEFPPFRDRLIERFGRVRTMKPDASREESMETYLVCLGFGEEKWKRTGKNVHQRRQVRKQKRKRKGY